MAKTSSPWPGWNSAANDLLKLLSACGLNSSYLRPLWDKTVANFAFAPQRAGMLHPGGGWFVNGCCLGFDKARRRGVVVLANSYESGANWATSCSKASGNRIGVLSRPKSAANSALPMPGNTNVHQVLRWACS